MKENQASRLLVNNYKRPSCHLGAFGAHHLKLKKSSNRHKNQLQGQYRLLLTPHDCKIIQSKNSLEY